MASIRGAIDDRAKEWARYFAVSAFGQGKMSFQTMGAYGPGHTGNVIPRSNQSHILDVIAELGGSARSMVDDVEGIPSIETVAQHTRSDALKVLATYVTQSIQTDMNDPHFSMVPVQYIPPTDLAGYEEHFFLMNLTLPQEAAEFTQPHYIRFSSTSRRSKATRYNHGFEDNAEFIMTPEGQRRVGYKIMAVLNDLRTFVKINVTATLCSAEDFYQSFKIDPSGDTSALGFNNYRGGASILTDGTRFKYTSEFLCILDKPGGADRLWDWVGQMGDRKNVRWTHCLTIEGALANAAFSKIETDYSKRGDRALEMLEGGSSAIVEQMQRRIRGVNVLYEPTYEIDANRTPVLQMLASVMQTAQYWVLDPKQFHHSRKQLGATTAGDLYYLDLTSEHLDVRAQKWEDICRAAPCWDATGQLNRLVYEERLLRDGVGEIATGHGFKITNLAAFSPDPFLVHTSTRSSTFELVATVGNMDTRHFNLDDSCRLVDETVNFITSQIGKEAETDIRNLVVSMRDNFEVKPDTDGNVEGFLVATAWSSVPRSDPVQANPLKNISQPRLPNLIPIHTSDQNSLREAFAYELGDKSLFKVQIVNYAVQVADAGGNNINVSKPLINTGHSLQAWRDFAGRISATIGSGAIANFEGAFTDRFENANIIATGDSVEHWIRNVLISKSRNVGDRGAAGDDGAVDIFACLASGYVLVDAAGVDQLISIPSFLEAWRGDPGRYGNMITAIAAFFNDPTNANRNAVATRMAAAGGAQTRRLYRAAGGMREVAVVFADTARKYADVSPLSLMQTGGNRMMSVVVRAAEINDMKTAQNTNLPMVSSYVWLDKTVLGGLGGNPNLGMGAGDHNLRLLDGIDPVVASSPALLPMYMAAIGAPDFALFSTREDIENVKISVFKPFDGSHVVLPGFSTPHAISSVGKQLRSGMFGWDNPLTEHYVKTLLSSTDATRQFSHILYSIFSPVVDKRSRAPLTQGVAWWSEHFLPARMARNESGAIEPTALFEHTTMAMARTTVGMVHPFSRHNLGSFGEIGSGFDCTLRYGAAGGLNFQGMVTGGITVTGRTAGPLPGDELALVNIRDDGGAESAINNYRMMMQNVDVSLIPPILYVASASEPSGIFDFDINAPSSINTIFGYQVAKQIVEPPSQLYFITWLRGQNSENPGGLPALRGATDITNAAFAGSDFLTVGASGDAGLATNMVDFMAYVFAWLRNKGRVNATLPLQEFDRQVVIAASVMKQVINDTFDVADDIDDKIAAVKANSNAELERIYRQVSAAVPTVTAGAGSSASTSAGRGVSTTRYDAYLNTVKNSIGATNLATFSAIEDAEWPVVDTGLSIGSSWWLKFHHEVLFSGDRSLTMTASILRPRSPITGRFIGVPKIVPRLGNTYDILNEQAIRQIMATEGRNDNFHNFDKHYKSLASFRKNVDGDNVMFPHNVDDYRPNRFFEERMSCFTDWMKRAVAFACFSAFWSAQLLINIYQHRIFVPLTLIPCNPFIYCNTSSIIFVAAGDDLGFIGYSLNLESFATDNLRRVVGHYSFWLMPFLRQPQNVLYLAHVKMNGLLWGHSSRLVNSIAEFRPTEDGSEVDWDASRTDISTNAACRFVFHAGASLKAEDLPEQLNILGTHHVINSHILAGMGLPEQYIPKVPDNTMSHPGALVAALVYQFDRIIKDRDTSILHPKTLNDIRLNRPNTTGVNSPYAYRAAQWSGKHGEKQISTGSGPLATWGPGQGAALRGFASIIDRN